MSPLVVSDDPIASAMSVYEDQSWLLAKLDERIGLIWSDRVNSARQWGCFVVVVVFLSRRQSEQQSEQF
jgi:hypothetical protein